MLYPLGQISPAFWYQVAIDLTMPLHFIEYPCLPLGPLKGIGSIDVQLSSSMEICKVVRSGFIFLPLCMHNPLKQIAQSNNEGTSVGINRKRGV